MTRKALKDDRLGEYFVPAGTEIFISPFLIQHSPQLWETPDRFNPDRLSANKSQTDPSWLCVRSVPVRANASANSSPALKSRSI
jgi:cytochrome P450